MLNALVFTTFFIIGFFTYAISHSLEREQKYTWIHWLSNHLRPGIADLLLSWNKPFWSMELLLKPLLFYMENICIPIMIINFLAVLRVISVPSAVHLL